MTAKPLDRVESQATLRSDLGMDGDDAVQFFEAYAKRFDVELSSLNARWHEYFDIEPPRSSPREPIAWLVLLAVWLPLMFGANAALGITLPAWAVALGGALMLAVWRYVEYWPLWGILPPRPRREVSVLDLVEAARSKGWPAEAPQGAPTS
jgi:hypothetical protein